MDHHKLDELTDLAAANLSLIRHVIVWIGILTVLFALLAVGKIITLSRQASIETRQDGIERSIQRLEEEIIELVKISKGYLELGDKEKKEHRDKFLGQMRETVKEAVVEASPPSNGDGGDVITIPVPAPPSKMEITVKTPADGG